MVRDIYRDMCLASPKESAADRHAKFRLLCGGRLKLFVSGGAALDSETRDFLQKCFRVPEVVDGYGSTYHSFISHKSMMTFTCPLRYRDRKHCPGWKDSRWS